MAYDIIVTGDVGRSCSALATGDDCSLVQHGGSGTSDAEQRQTDKQPDTSHLCGKYSCVGLPTGFSELITNNIVATDA